MSREARVNNCGLVLCETRSGLSLMRKLLPLPASAAAVHTSSYGAHSANHPTPRQFLSCDTLLGRRKGHSLYQDYCLCNVSFPAFAYLHVACCFLLFARYRQVDAYCYPTSAYIPGAFLHCDGHGVPHGVYLGGWDTAREEASSCNIR